MTVDWVISENTFNSASKQDPIRSKEACEIDEKVLCGKDRSTDCEVHDDIPINQGDQAHLHTLNQWLQVPGFYFVIFHRDIG